MRVNILWVGGINHCRLKNVISYLSGVQSKCFEDHQMFFSEWQFLISYGFWHKGIPNIKFANSLTFEMLMKILS